MIGVWTNINPIQAGLFTQADQQQNAREIWGYFQARGWSLNAVAGMLGNMQAESYINPAQWQIGHTIEDPSLPNDTGFGLVQWTPWQKYVDSSPYFGEFQAGSNWRSNYIRQLDRLQYELEYDVQYPNQGQWISATYSGWSWSFEDFATAGDWWYASSLSRVFFLGYERGTWDESRATNADYWQNYLEQYGPLPPSGNRLPIWLLFKLKARYYR